MKSSEAKIHHFSIVAQAWDDQDRHSPRKDWNSSKYTTYLALLAACLLHAAVGHGATITVPDQYASIQEAVDHAGVGDEVFVRSGVYFENVLLSYRNPYLDLRGEDAATTVINGSGGTCIEVVGIGSTGSASISGLTLTNGPDDFGGSCLRIYGSGEGSWTITNNIFRDTNGSGILVLYDNVALSGNLFLRCASRGVFVSSGATVSIVNNTFVAVAGTGVYAHPQATYAKVSGNIFAYGHLDYSLTNDLFDYGCNLFWSQSSSRCGSAPTDFEADPQFCDYFAENFSLCADSPANPGNQPLDLDCGQIGAFGSACSCEPQASATATWGSLKNAYR